MSDIDLKDARYALVIAKQQVRANETAIADHVSAARIARARRAELRQRVRDMRTRVKELTNDHRSS